MDVPITTNTPTPERPSHTKRVLGMVQNAESRLRWIEPALAGLLFFLSLAGLSNSGPWAWLLSLAVCVGAATASWYPRIAALTTTAALVGFLFLPGQAVSVAGIGLFINVFSLMRQQVAERIPLIGLLFGAGFLAMVMHASQGTRDALISSTLMGILLALSIGSGHVWRVKEDQLTTTKEAAQKQVTELRTALARDLHDTVAQTLSNAAMRAHMTALDDDLSPEHRDQLNRIASDCSTASQDLRQLLATLRDLDRNPPSMTGGLASAASLSEVVKQQTQRLWDQDFRVDCALDLVEPITATRAETLSSLTVEAVNNMLKHAKPGTSCHIHVRSDEHKIVAIYANETQQRRSHRNRLGLVGMRERVKLLDGSLDITNDDGWWVLEVVLPQAFRPATSPVPPTDE